jgi:hypothetical protein
MNRRGKLSAIVICALLCGVGAIFSPRGHDATPQLKSRVLPIDNRAKQTKIRLWA